MSKQIAVLLDSSGSMFQPVAGGNANDKISEASDGAQLFVENVLDQMGITPGSQFALSVHRFAQSYQLLPGGAQVSSTDAGAAAALGAMSAAVAAIEDQAASQAAVGSLTDVYDAVRRTSDYMIANAPSFGAPDARYILLLSDGIQTVAHNGTRDRAGYEAEQGVSFASLLNGRGIRLRAWGVGLDALAVLLRDLTDQAVDPSSSAGSVLGHPGSYTKVLFPYSELGPGKFPNCTTIIMSDAASLVDDNGILPLRPAGGTPSGLLWEQFGLPAPNPKGGSTFGAYVDHRDFEVDVDGSTRVLLLGLVASSRAEVALQATAPSGAVFVPASAGTRTVAVPTARLLKIASPEEGTWRVRVSHGGGTPTTCDLLARGVFKEFVLGVRVDPFRLAAPGEVTVSAAPTIAGRPAAGKLRAVAHVLGGATVELAPARDGTFSGRVPVAQPGLNLIRVEVHGVLDGGRSIHRTVYAQVQVGRIRDPRFRVHPTTYEQGREYRVRVELVDATLGRATQVSFGRGIEVLALDAWTESQGEARIRVAPDAFVGWREPLLYYPAAESVTPVQVVASAGGGPAVQGRICCLRFDAHGRLIGIVLCDGTAVCVREHDERVRALLEAARGCLASIQICRE